MQNETTELAQRLKAEANTIADAIDRLKAFPGDELIDLSQHEGEQVDIDIATLNQWYELSSPANVLALVEALEKAQQRIGELESKLANPVQLPKTNGYWTEQEKAYEEAITLAKRQVRLAGFRCEGDE
ncbi:ead/Ea22-like family protein [Klebsiella variicola]|uniref:hypothetical protein n=1 Tax=Klebsiella variicola TaxID=244366 RepID=UPI0010DB9350|nr:hypothetical protein [Klebsiella variicola]VGP71782.1 hypothetical protein SB5387_01078 [Klebsiella variicola]